MTTTELNISKVSKNKRLYKDLGYSGIETVSIVTKLNLLLCDYNVHYQKLRNFHWNVKGKDFFELHEKFEVLYNKAMKNIDIIAERVRIFGKTPISSMKQYLADSSIDEVPTDLTSEKMVSEIVNDFQALLGRMVSVVDASIEIGDVGTEDMIKTMIKDIEKDHWMLNAWLNESGSELN